MLLALTKVLFQFLGFEVITLKNVRVFDPIFVWHFCSKSFSTYLHFVLFYISVFMVSDGVRHSGGTQRK